MTESIVLKAVLEMQRELGRVSARIETQTDALLVHVADDRVTSADIKERLASIEDLVKKIQRSRSREKGFIAGVSGVVAAVVTGAGLYLQGMRLK
jgi:hypothetical protein